MATLVGVLVLAAPFLAVAALMVTADRRRARRDAEIQRQIMLTDALHVKLGPLVAPVVRRVRRGWRVAVAVPLERPAVVTVVLATVDEVFAGERYEVALSRQTPATGREPALRPARLGESLSWT